MSEVLSLRYSIRAADAPGITIKKNIRIWNRFSSKIEKSFWKIAIGIINIPKKRIAKQKNWNNQIKTNILFFILKILTQH